MQPGFPKRSIITSRGDEPIRGLNGQGRYFYIALGDRAICIDRNLCTAANYAGSGSWTVNPIVATITFGVTNVNSMLYIDRSQQMWFFRSGTNTVYVVDANPSSATFNQLLSNFVIAGGTLQGGTTPSYDYVRNRLYRATGSNTAVIQQINNAGTAIDTNISYVWPANNNNSTLRSVSKYFQKTSSFVGLGYQGASLEFNSSALNTNPNIGVRLVSAFNEGFGWTCEDYIYIQNNGSITVVNDRFELIATISAQARWSRPGYSESQKVLVTGSWFTNSVSFVSKASLTNLANVAKGYLGAGEQGTREIVVSDDVAIIVPYGTSGTSWVHVYDVVTRTYVGYINTPISLPDIGFYATGLIAKNRVEI